MKRTIVAIPLATALLGAAEEPKPVQSAPAPAPTQQTLQAQKPATSPTQALQAQKPLTPTAQKTIPARVHIGVAPRGERNAFFMGVDYQLGMMTSTEQTCTSNAQCYA
ncbi:putative Outer membrane protein, partial [Helicobacter heilmannii]